MPTDFLVPQGPRTSCMHTPQSIYYVAWAQFQDQVSRLLANRESVSEAPVLALSTSPSLAWFQFSLLCVAL